MVVRLQIPRRQQPAHADLQCLGDVLERAHGGRRLIVLNLREHIACDAVACKLALRQSTHQPHLSDFLSKRHLPSLPGNIEYVNIIY